jgi:hypothetical protein
VRDGDDEQKEDAAGYGMPFGVRCCEHGEIASADGIPPLVALVKVGNRQQSECSLSFVGFVVMC